MRLQVCLPQAKTNPYIPNQMFSPRAVVQGSCTLSGFCTPSTADTQVTFRDTQELELSIC